MKPRDSAKAHAFITVFVLLSLAFIPRADAALVSLTFGHAASPYTEDFDSLASSGTSSTTPTGWEFSEAGTNANTLYNTGTGSNNAGDTYSFGSAASTERAFGGLQSGTLIPTIGAGFTNNTGLVLMDVELSYHGEQWRLGFAGRTDQLDFQYSTDATSLSVGTYTDANALDFTSPDTTTAGAKDGNAAGNSATVTSSLSSLGVANGNNLYMRWSDFNATNADDGLAVDDFSLKITKLGTEGVDRTLSSIAAPSTLTIQNGSGATDSTLTANIASVETFAGILQNGGTAALALTKAGAGTLTLSNSGNSYTGTTTVAAGRLQLGASNVIPDASPVSLNGGTLAVSTAGFFSDTLGSLSLSSSSTIDMGTNDSEGSRLTFANIGSWTGTLSVYNWTGTLNTPGGIDRLLFTSTATAPGAVQFFSGAGTGAIGSGGAFSGNELVPVPEPGAVLAGLLLLAPVAWRERRYFLRCRGTGS